MLINILPFILILVPLFIAWRLNRYRIAKKTGAPFSFRNELIVTSFFVYILALVNLTLFPIITESYGWYRNWNLTPFRTIAGYLKQPFWIISIRNLAGNILLLVPFGVLVPLLDPRIRTMKKAVLSGFLFSLTIELLQLSVPYFSSRSPDIDDIILNTLGAILGFMIFQLLFKLHIKRKGTNEIRKIN